MQIDWLADRELGELQRFFDEHWQRGHVLARDAELVRWQHRFPGDPDRLSLLIAREHAEIVGILGMIFTTICARGRPIPGAWLAAWIAAPAAREHQAGLRLLHRAINAHGLQFVGVTGVNQTALGIYRALGFSICDSVPRWVRVLSDDALAALLAGRAAPHRVPDGQPPPVASLKISAWSETSVERWDETWRRRIAPRLVGTWRDASYLRWRYLRHPRFTYAVRVAEGEDGSLRGLAVHRVADVLGGEGRVVRVLELLGDRDAASALAWDVVAAGERAGAAFAEMYCTSAAVAEPLRACGFTPKSQPAETLPALFEPLDYNEPTLTGAFFASEALGWGAEMLRPEALYVTRSDSDQDRPNVARESPRPVRWPRPDRSGRRSR